MSPSSSWSWPWLWESGGELTASTARDWSGRSPRGAALIGGTGALAMIGLRAGVAVTGRPD
ncbi:hypothetical protein [Streptomyces sp. NPDC057381]|uniref:hypothetical protein n=1 Tax=Streptomyces sp. NPDC057381 TaxID=3346111 RepID=UPI0036433880